MRLAFYRTAEFLALQREWYAKLPAGLDIEGGQEYRRRLPDIDPRNASVRDREAIQAYFREASAFLHSGKFRSRLERRIWALHAAGRSQREIARDAGVTRWRVETTIERYRRKAGLSRQRPPECGSDP